MFYHARNSPSPILPAFGYSTIMPEKPKVQRRGERKVRLEINAASKAVRWLEGSDAATRMRWQARAEELGVIVPKGGIARENLPKWVPAIARLICDEEGM
jgi:hypothetical protein